jgi:hypothetical protein
VFRWDQEHQITYQDAPVKVTDLYDRAHSAPKRSVTVEVPVLDRDLPQLSWAEAIALSHLVFGTQDPLGERYEPPVPDDDETA